MKGKLMLLAVASLLLLAATAAAAQLDVVRGTDGPGERRQRVRRRGAATSGLGPATHDVAGPNTATRRVGSAIQAASGMRSPWVVTRRSELICRLFSNG